ncbi:hypothetical protein CsSME_00042785 [Camellia sinensis var. sinensis]
MAAVEQFKLSSEFQIAVDAAVAKSLAREGDGGARPSNVAAAELVDGETKEEIIRRFHVYWDSGWTIFKYKAEELFPGTNFNRVRPGEEDIAQTSLDEGVEKEDLVSSEGEEGGV